MLAACAEDARMPAGDPSNVALQTPGQARQAPIASLDGLLHVGADVAAPADGLPQVARHGEARVSHGPIADGVGAAELVAYLRADAAGYLDPGEEADADDQFIPGGLVLRFAAAPPTVRVAGATPPALLDETVRVVQAINAALPQDWQLRFGGEFVPSEAMEAADGEILVAVRAAGGLACRSGAARAGRISGSRRRATRSSPRETRKLPGGSISSPAGSGSTRRKPKGWRGWA